MHFFYVDLRLQARQESFHKPILLVGVIHVRKTPPTTIKEAVGARPYLAAWQYTSSGHLELRKAYRRLYGSMLGACT